MRAELLDQPRAKQRRRGVAQRFGIGDQVVTEAVVERRVVGAGQPARHEMVAEQREVDQRNARTAQYVLDGQDFRIEHQSALDLQAAQPQALHQLRPEMPARQPLDAHVHEFVVPDERLEVLTRVAGRNVRVADDAEPHRPQQVADAVGDGGPRIKHRHVHFAGWGADAVRTHDVDLDLRVCAAEFLQDRHDQVRRKTRRHLHAQRPQAWRLGVADFVDGVFEPVERARHDRQQVLARRREHERVRPAVEELDADQVLERDHVARQGALRNVQRARGTCETAITGHAFERTQGVQGKPSPVDTNFVHYPALAGRQ